MREPVRGMSDGSFLPRLFVSNHLNLLTADAGRAEAQKRNMLMAQMKINGWDKKEVFMLYNFLEAYERGNLSTYEKDENLFKEHPEVKDLEFLFNSVSCSFKKKAKMINDQIPATGKNQIFLLRHGTPLLSFLYHVRNSIAHGIIEKRGNEALVVDWCKKHPLNMSARGFISIDTINSFTNILNKIEI